jgi:DNA-binding transcriptional MerR regulator
VVEPDGGAVQVHELAQRTGVSARSIRHYDRAGLLDSQRRPNGYREFDRTAINQVKTIRRLLESGLTINDIVLLSPCLTAAGEFDGCADARRLLRAHIERLQDSIARDHNTLQLLRERERRMTTPEREPSLSARRS